MGVPHHALAVLLIALLGYGLRLPVKRGTLLSTRLLAFTERRNHRTRTLASTTSFSTPSTAAPSEAMLELLKENDEAFVKQLQRLAYRRAHNSNGVEAQDRRVLLQSIEQRLPSMLPDNVVTICWALGTLRLPPRSSGMLRVTDLLLERLDFTRQELAASPNNLTMVLVGLARLNVMVRPGKDSFLSHALPQALPLMDSQQLSNCIWSLGKIGATWDGLTLRLRRAMGDALVRICSSKTDPLTPQGIANSIYGLSQLRTKWGLLPIAVTDALTAALASRAPKMNEQEVSNSLSGLGRLGVQWSSLPAALRESLCSAVLRHLTEQTSASPQGQQDKKQQRQQKQQKQQQKQQQQQQQQKQQQQQQQQQKATYAGQGIAMSIHGLGRMDADFSTLPPTVRAALLQAVAQHAGALNDIEVSNMLYGLGKMGCPFVAGPSTANANASAGGGGGEGGGGGRRDKKKGSTSKGEMAMAGAALGALFSAANREAWRLTGQGVSNSLWGLMLMNTSWALLPASTQASLLRALSREAPRMDEQHVGNAVYALGRMGLTWTALPATLQGGLLDAMTTHAPEMPPAGVVMVMLGLGRLGLGWHALPFGLQDGLTQTIIGILRAPSTGGSGVSAVVHALSTTAPRWADLGAGLQTAVVEAVARAFWQPRAPVPVPAYKTKVAPAVSDAVTAAAATAAAAAALPPTGSLGLHGLLSPPMIGSKPKQLPSSSFSSSISLQGQGQEEEGPLTLSSLLEMQSSVAAALLLSCPPATTPASSSPSSTTPPSPLAPAPSMAANARAFWESSAAKAPRVKDKDKDREREREQLGDWDERERASKASMLSKDRPTPRGFSSVAGSPPGQGSGSAPASASAPLPVRLTSRAASPEEVFLFDRDESPASPRPKHLSPTGQWQGHVLGPAQGRGLPPTQGARADQDVQQPGQACAMPGFSSDLSSPFAPEVAPRHGKRDHLVLSLAKMGARWDGLGIGAQQGLMDSLASSLNPTWEGGVVVTEQGMGVVGVLGVLEGLASLGTPWARLRPDVQAAVRSGLRRTAPHMDASSIASAILHLSDLQVPWAELENPASAWGGAGGGTHAALRSAILREANYGPEVLSRLLFGLGRLLRWQDLHPDVRLCLKAALVESQLVASPQAEGVERSLSGLAFMQCGWADLSSSARLSLLSSLHRTAGNATADQTANIVKALGAMSAPFASLPQQVQTCLKDGVSSVGGSLRGEALVSVLAGLRGMGLVWTDLSKKIQSVLTESLEVSLLSSSAPHADKDSSLAPSLSLARGRAASEALEEFGRLGAQWFQVPPSLLLALQAAVVAPLPEPQDQAGSEDKARVSEAAGDAVDGDGRGHVVACWLGGMATMGLRLSELGPDAQASVLSWARRIDTLGLSVTELSQALNRLGVLGLSQRSGSGSDDAISAAVLAAVNQVCARGEPAEVAAALLGLALMDFTWQDLPPASVDSIVAAVVRSSSQRKPRSSCRVEEFWLLHAPEEPTLLQQQQQGDEVAGRGRLCSSRHSSLGGTDMTAGACASIMHSLALLCFDSSPQQEQQEHEEGRWKGLRRMHGALATTITRLGVGALSEADKEHVIVYSHVLQHLLLEPGAEGEGEGGGFLLRADPVPLSSSGSCDEYERPLLGDTLQHEVVASLSRAITQAGQADSLIVNADFSPFKGALPVDATIVDKKDGHIVAFLAVDTPSHYTETGVLRRADKLKEDLYRRAHPKAQFVHVSAEQIGHLGSTTVGHELATFLALVRSRCPSTEIPPSPHADALYDWSHCDGWVVRRAANELRSALDCGSGESPLRRTRWQDLAYSWY